MMEAKKHYNIGYVPGVYDLFHIGHLNLLKRAKDRCDYLIVGVLTDELVIHFKKNPPFIPFEERISIVESIRYVDKAVMIDFDNIDKMAAWRLYHYDCHFSGDDHGAEWDEDIKKLRELGANLEFFPYTQSTSSSYIKKLINNRLV